MEIQFFLPDPGGVRCDGVELGTGLATFKLTATQTAVLCPDCGQPSCRVHSRYQRLLADLPWMGTPVRLRIQVRRFFCGTPGCPRQVFAERLPQMAAAHGRKTHRLTQALCQIGFALGGEAGSRLAGYLRMPAGGDTLLRLLRRAPPVAMPAVTVLGVDDWAWHKGQRYGTILCDLERHRPVDLLPERSAGELANWLAAHPGVQVITRDRAGYYAQGARAGAPQAVQVADRFHLLCNLREALVRMLDRHHRDLAEAARATILPQPEPPEPRAEPGPVSPPSALPTSRAQQAKDASRWRRLERYRRVVELHRQGLSRRKIAQHLGMHRGTVRRFLRAGQFPERAARLYTKRTDPFLDYLHQRWEQGCRNAAQLAKELSQRAFQGSYSAVRRRLAAWREPGGSHTTGPKSTPKEHSPIQRPSAHRVSWLLLGRPEDRSAEEEAFLEALWRQSPVFQTAAEVAQNFARMVQQRQVEKLEGWMAQTHAAEAPQELRAFADGLRQDYKAVKAALSLAWSNGQVEGQVNRLKLIKRQMYGRAGFDLLRQRVLHAA